MEVKKEAQKGPEEKIEAPKVEVKEKAQSQPEEQIETLKAEFSIE